MPRRRCGRGGSRSGNQRARGHRHRRRGWCAPSVSVIWPMRAVTAASPVSRPSRRLSTSTPCARELLGLRMAARRQAEKVTAARTKENTRNTARPICNHSSGENCAKIHDPEAPVSEVTRARCAALRARRETDAAAIACCSYVACSVPSAAALTGAAGGSVSGSHLGRGAPSSGELASVSPVDRITTTTRRLALRPWAVSLV